MKVYDSGQSGTTGEIDTEPDRVKVGIAESEVTTDGATLTTSGLGSCVGVALYDETAGVAGLVHVMLPSIEDGADDDDAKFADAGTAHLIEEMERHGAEPRSIEAKIAGGSDMLDFSKGGSGIGARNAETVRSTLEEHGVPIVGEDVGGEHGRSLRLDPQTGDLVVRNASDEDARL